MTGSLDQTKVLSRNSHAPMGIEFFPEIQFPPCRKVGGLLLSMNAEGISQGPNNIPHYPFPEHPVVRIKHWIRHWWPSLIRHAKEQYYELIAKIASNYVILYEN